MTPEEIYALPYRACVGIMLVNADGKVFVGQRVDTKGAWQMPQGGIDSGEKPKAAALRELVEETGVSADLVTVEAKHPEWLKYDLPHDIVPKIWKGKGHFRGQKQRWFLLRFNGTDDQVNIHTKHAEFSVWKWMDASELVANIVPFKREIYRAVVAEFRDKL